MVHEITLFLSGFAIVLSLIALANTIDTGLRLRATRKTLADARRKAGMPE